MISIGDVAIFTLWLGILSLAVIIYRNNRLIKDPASKYFLPAFLLHALGSLSFALIYAYYYGYGDTFGFYNISKFLRQSISDDPGKIVPVFTSFDMDFFNGLATQYGYRGWYAMMPHTISVAKASTFFSFFTGVHYLPISLFFGFFSFLGSWAMYRTFQRAFPALYREFAYIVLFFPSIWFWGSGLSKDSLTFGGLGFLLYGTYHLFFLRKNLIQNSFITIVAVYLLLNVKPYVVVAFLPAALSWFIIGYHQKIRSAAVRKLFFPVAMLLLIAGFGLINQFLTTNLEQFSLDNVQGNIMGYQANLDRYGTAGSSYTLFSFGSGNAQFFSMMLPAIITTFFRPFPWEVHNPLALFAGGESLLMLFLFWRLYRRLGSRLMLRSLYTEPIVLFCVIFALIFGVSVGIASQNFGTLVRYRLPAIPMFMASLFIAYYSVTGKSLWQRSRKASPATRNMHWGTNSDSSVSGRDTARE